MQVEIPAQLDTIGDIDFWIIETQKHVYLVRFKSISNSPDCFFNYYITSNANASQ